MEFELVLPCYNESKSIQQILERAIFAAKESGFTSNSYNLLLVENGSKDDSRTVMQNLKNDPNLGPWFQIIPIDINQGYGFGIWTGLQNSKAPIVGWSHADQQCDPMDAFKAYHILIKNSSSKILVKGIRRGRSFKEKLVSRIFDIFAFFLLRMRVYEINAQPKVFKRELLSYFSNPPKDFAFDIYALYQAKKNGYKLETFTVEFPPRIHGLSNWAFSLKNRFKVIFNMIKYMYQLGKRQT